MENIVLNYVQSVMVHVKLNSDHPQFLFHIVPTFPHYSVYIHITPYFRLTYSHI